MEKIGRIERMDGKREDGKLEDGKLDDSTSDDGRLAGTWRGWEDFRRQMPIAQRWAYFDHSAVGPLPTPTRDAILRWTDEATYQGDVCWPAWAARVEQLRAQAARLLGAGQDEIALTRNTTAGISAVAEGFPWQPGDNVVTLADEFPSNQYPWLHLASQGVETRRVPVGPRGEVDLERVEAACDARTRVVAISWISYWSGWRNDVDAVVELAHRHGALVFLDAIQGLGVFPLDVAHTKVDFLAADGHKWMLGPEGAGIFYIRREHLDRLRPVGVGWNSVVGAFDFSRIALELKPSAARYEGGSQNMVGMIGLAASLDLLLSLGTANIAARVIEVTDLLCQRLGQLGAEVISVRQPGRQSGIVLFELPGRDPMAVRARCFEQQIALSCRSGRLRLSAHAYNNADDIERLVGVLGGL